MAKNIQQVLNTKITVTFIILALLIPVTLYFSSKLINANYNSDITKAYTLLFNQEVNKSENTLHDNCRWTDFSDAIENLDMDFISENCEIDALDIDEVIVLNGKDSIIFPLTANLDKDLINGIVFKTTGGAYYECYQYENNVINKLLCEGVKNSDGTPTQGIIIYKKEITTDILNSLSQKLGCKIEFLTKDDAKKAEKANFAIVPLPDIHDNSNMNVSIRQNSLFSNVIWNIYVLSLLFLIVLGVAYYYVMSTIENNSTNPVKSLAAAINNNKQLKLENNLPDEYGKIAEAVELFNTLHLSASENKSEEKTEEKSTETSEVTTENTKTQSETNTAENQENTNNSAENNIKTVSENTENTETTENSESLENPESSEQLETTTNDENNSENNDSTEEKQNSDDSETSSQRKGGAIIDLDSL